MTNLAEIRGKIDANDLLIVHQLRRRMELGLVVGRLKRIGGLGVSDFKRERPRAEARGSDFSLSAKSGPQIGSPICRFREDCGRASGGSHNIPCAGALLRCLKAEASAHPWSFSEIEVLGRVTDASRGAWSPNVASSFFRRIIDETVKLLNENPMLSAYQGMPGAHGELAAETQNKKAIPISCGSFQEVLMGVGEGIFDFGEVPIENSIGGAVENANLLLANTSLGVSGEIILPIHHCLLALPETDFSGIKIVLSHPQALKQCSNAIAENGWEAVEHNDTAGASLKVASELLRETGAISRNVCAQLYGLKIVRSNLENDPTNRTRFLIFEAKMPEMGGSRHIVSIGLPDMKDLALFLNGIRNAGAEITRVFSERHMANLLSALKDDVRERLGELLQGRTEYKVKRDGEKFVVEFDRKEGVGKIAGWQGLVHIGSYEPAKEILG
ncbi:hypothetical protein J4441_01370 [Candidatus Micrarchaeota archaeon]|nr:hypothetical protein [Candidatus Micrarchaeota archaeon]